MSPQPKPLVIGISGVSSSGKTTIARLLRDIPMKNGLQDWDCFEAIDVEKLAATLAHIKDHGRIPDTLESKEDQNSVGEINIDSGVLQRERERISKHIGGTAGTQIFLVDGFLLYSVEMKPVWQLLDAKIFLRTSYAKAKARREARKGYVTLAGFWEDPPGYVDDIVWPNYVKDHAHLFVDGNVEGLSNVEACNSMAINVAPEDAEDNLTKCFLWASSILETILNNHLEGVVSI